MSGKSHDFSVLCLIPEILANLFSPMFSGYIKSSLLGDIEREQVGENSQRGQSGREQLQSRSGGTLFITDNLPSPQKQEGREIR